MGFNSGFKGLSDAYLFTCFGKGYGRVAGQTTAGSTVTKDGTAACKNCSTAAIRNSFAIIPLLHA